MSQRKACNSKKKKPRHKKGILEFDLKGRLGENYENVNSGTINGELATKDGYIVLVFDSKNVPHNIAVYDFEVINYIPSGLAKIIEFDKYVKRVSEP